MAQRQLPIRHPVVTALEPNAIALAPSPFTIASAPPLVIRFTMKLEKEEARAKTSGETTNIIREYRINDKDTGSAEIQVAVLTENIKRLTDHLRAHRKDVHSRRGLQMMVSRRRRLLNYLSNEDVNRYQTLISRLGLRR